MTRVNRNGNLFGGAAEFGGSQLPSFGEVGKQWRQSRFVICIYATLWFNSKLKPRATEAAKIVFKAMKLIASLPAEERKVVEPTFERGFYWGHAENLFLGCLASDAS